MKTDTYKYHIVREGETPEGIAHKYGLSVQQLYKLNPKLPRNPTYLQFIGITLRVSEGVIRATKMVAMPDVTSVCPHSGMLLKQAGGFKRIKVEHKTSLNGPTKVKAYLPLRVTVKAHRLYDANSYLAPLWRAHQVNKQVYGHHSPYQHHFQAGGRDAVAFVGGSIGFIAGAGSMLASGAVSEGLAYMGRTGAYNFIRDHFITNPFVAVRQVGWRHFAIKAGVNLLGQTATNLVERNPLSQIDMVGLGADLVLIDGYSALAGGIGEFKVDILSGAYKGKFTDWYEGIAKFGLGLSFGLTGGHINNRIGPNAVSNTVVDATLKLWEEATTKVFVDGATDEWKSESEPKSEGKQ